MPLVGSDQCIIQPMSRILNVLLDVGHFNPLPNRRRLPRLAKISQGIEMVSGLPDWRTIAIILEKGISMGH